MHADGRRVRRLTGSDAELPRWSPDGKKLTYVANLVHVEMQDGNPDAYYTDRATIKEMNADGTGKRVLASSGYTGDVEWSPNGRWSPSTRAASWTTERRNRCESSVRTGAACGLLRRSRALLIV
jgi:WD40-like Beta Propeller Repeat